MRSLILLAIVPLAAVVAWAKPAQPRDVAFPSTKPISFSQHAIVHGQVEPRPVIEATFRFTNTSSEPAEIVELLPSCGCLRPKLAGGHRDGESTRFAAGESGEFTIGVETANESPGQQLYSVLVRSQANGHDYSQVVRYAVTLPSKKLTVQCNGLIFTQIQGEAGTKEFDIFDPRPKRAQITSVDCDHPLVESLIETTDDPTLTRVVVNVAAGLKPGTDERTALRIETDDPAYPVIRVPVHLRGPKVR